MPQREYTSDCYYAARSRLVRAKASEHPPTRLDTQRSDDQMRAINAFNLA